MVKNCCRDSKKWWKGRKNSRGRLGRTGAGGLGKREGSRPVHFSSRLYCLPFHYLRTWNRLGYSILPRRYSRNDFFICPLEQPGFGVFVRKNNNNNKILTRIVQFHSVVDAAVNVFGVAPVGGERLGFLGAQLVRCRSSPIGNLLFFKVDLYLRAWVAIKRTANVHRILISHEGIHDARRCFAIDLGFSWKTNKSQVVLTLSLKKYILPTFSREMYQWGSENWYKNHLSIWVSYEKPSSSYCVM